MGDERRLADAWLDFHRQTLLWKCGGLTAEQLKLRAIEPSDLSLLGLVRHMAEVERDWFRTRFAGAHVGYLYCSDDDLNAEFNVLQEWGLRDRTDDAALIVSELMTNAADASVMLPERPPIALRLLNSPQAHHPLTSAAEPKADLDIPSHFLQNTSCTRDSL